MSDHTDHKAPAVMISIKSILEKLIKQEKKLINIISDSPTSQYRNHKMFYLVQQFAKEYRVTIRWIYLEAGHGKGIPDGIRAVVKKAARDITAFNLDIPHYSVKDFLESGLQEKLPSIEIITYSKDAVISLAENIRETTGIVGTMKIHDICCYPQSNNISVRNLSQEKAREVELRVINKKSNNKEESNQHTSDEESMEDELEDIDEDGGSQDESEAEICILL